MGSTALCGCPHFFSGFVPAVRINTEFLPKVSTRRVNIVKQESNYLYHLSFLITADKFCKEVLATFNYYVIKHKLAPVNQPREDVNRIDFF